MKKLYSPIMLLAMMVAALSLTACGDDDDGYNSLNGRVTLDEDGEKTTLYAYDDAEWVSGHLDCYEGDGRYLSRGATFSVTLSKSEPSDVERGSYNHLVYKHSYEFGLQAVNTLKPGKEVDVGKINFFPINEYHPFSTETYSGSVYVESIQENRITLKIKNFKFKRIKEFHVGNSSFATVTIDGKITFVNPLLQSM